MTIPTSCIFNIRLADAKTGDTTIVLSPRDAAPTRLEFLDDGRLRIRREAETVRRAHLFHPSRTYSIELPAYDVTSADRITHESYERALHFRMTAMLRGGGWIEQPLDLTPEGLAAAHAPLMRFLSRRAPRDGLNL